VSPQIIKEYVDTGKIRWVFRNLAFLSQESLDAAEATHCANEQDKFWPYHDKLFSIASATGIYTRDNLKKLAKDAGLDETAFNACLDSKKYAAQVSKDNQLAEQSGVNSTPSFLVNGRIVMLTGNNEAAWIANFKKELDAELAK